MTISRRTQQVALQVTPCKGLAQALSARTSACSLTSARAARLCKRLDVVKTDDCDTPREDGCEASATPYVLV